jgi:hypothetical protein
MGRRDQVSVFTAEIAQIRATRNINDFFILRQGN